MCYRQRMDVRSRGHELFLVVPRAVGRHPSLDRRLEQFGSVLPNDAIRAIDLYLAPGAGKLILAIALTPVDAGARAELLRAAQEVDAVLIDSDQLTPEEVRRFRTEILPRYQRTRCATVAELRRVVAAAAAPTPPPRGRMEVRFRRGEQWQLGRARDLTPDGIYVASSCPPRQGEVVDLELWLGKDRAATRAAVVHVTPPYSAQGVGGFGACFIIADDAERLKLDQVLDAARTVTPIPAPPARRDGRYPVRWPIFAWLAGGWLTMVVLDVSRRGLFVATGVPLGIGELLELTIPVDDGSEPRRATARVVRAIHEAEALSRGLAVGFGLEITGMDAGDGLAEFVSRVAARAERRIVVGAGQERGAALLGELTGVGYVASGAVEAHAILERTTVGAAPDLVLLDDSLPGDGGRTIDELSEVLVRRQVPTVLLHGESPAAARRRVDEVFLG